MLCVPALKALVVQVADLVLALPVGSAIAEQPPIAVRGVKRAIAAAVVLIAGALAWFAAESVYSWRSPLANAKFIRLSDFAGTAQAAAISRDGELVAFLAERDGQTDAWVREAGSGAYRNLTHGEVPDLVNPVIRTLGFSADSSLVSIWTRRSGPMSP